VHIVYVSESSAARHFSKTGALIPCRVLYSCPYVGGNVAVVFSYAIYIIRAAATDRCGDHHMVIRSNRSAIVYAFYTRGDGDGSYARAVCVCVCVPLSVPERNANERDRLVGRKGK